jgi:dipeptidyl aminopeptidase/acylaminoacyl peptidase
VHAHWRTIAFVLILVGCIASSGVYLALAYNRAHGSAPPSGVRVTTGASLASPDGPELLFRNAIPDKTFGELAVAPLSHPNQTRTVASLKCDRVDYENGRGLCLTSGGSWPTTSYVAKIFDASFKVVGKVPLTGIPSRARISADGRLGATTVFVNGDSYAPGNFSTRTNIIDMRSGTIIVNLERFHVTRDGEPFSNTNFNFWGVTFARDDNRFYATLGSGAQTYLVQGNLRQRTMEVIHEHVECPSLSPDGTRIAFKRSLNSHGSWRLYVLDLKTMKETALAEPSSVDDQVEWIDNDHISYWLHSDTWSVPADGTGAPTKLLTDASSAVLVRAA